jgi:hypothetical protein
MLAEGDDVLVPVDVDGHTVMLSIRPNSRAEQRAGEWEQDIVSRRPSLQAVLGDLAAVAGGLGSQLQDTGASNGPPRRV